MLKVNNKYKILYAANQFCGSYSRISRFIKNIDKNKFDIITAGFSNSSSLQLDFNLESILNFTSPDSVLNFKNNNFKLFFKKVIELKPDLIISDFEPYTSCIALDLGIEVWQVSPVIFYWACPRGLKNKFKINTQTYFFNYEANNSYYRNILLNSDKKYIYSHMCNSSIELADGFEWVKPFQGLSDNSPDECDGETDILFDKFFNNKSVKVKKNILDPESIINSSLTSMNFENKNNTKDLLFKINKHFSVI